VWQPSFPWVPVLLVSLGLLTLIGGLSVGDFYWNDLRPDVGRIGANLAQVRDRQRVMMGNFAEAQALLLEQQRHLTAQAQDLRRREQAVYEARLEIDAQRVQLAQALQSAAERERQAAKDGGNAEGTGAVPDSAAPRIAVAADLARTAAEGLSRDDDLETTRAALSLTEALLARSSGDKGNPMRTALAAAKSRLAEVRPVDRAALAERLQAVRERAVGLRPVVARLLRSNRQVDNGSTAQQRTDDPVEQAARSLDRQFQAARLALEAADSASFRTAIQGIDRWLNAFYEPRLPETGAVLTELRTLAGTPIAADVAPLLQALVELGRVLREMAAGAGEQ
jgi:uncharacterized protein HemX